MTDDERLRRILDMNARGMTLRDIGKEVGVTGERVRQILRKEKRLEERRARHRALGGLSREALLGASLDDLYFESHGLDIRVHNVLKNADIKTFGDIIQRTCPELLREPNLGKRSLGALLTAVRELGLDIPEQHPEPPRAEPPEPPVELADRTVDDFEWSVRVWNCLRIAEVRTVRDLIGLSRRDLLSFRNFGKTSLREVEDTLAFFGLELRQ